MPDKEGSITPVWLIPTVLRWMPPLLFLILFFKEIATTLVLVIAWLWHLFAGSILAITAADAQAILIVSYNVIIGFGICFLPCLFLLAAQALLPVGSLQDTFQTALHFLLFILGGHGAAIFVKDGKVHADAKELRRSRPGVAVIDFNSALVLERVVEWSRERVGHRGGARSYSPCMGHPSKNFTEGMQARADLWSGTDLHPPRGKSSRSRRYAQNPGGPGGGVVWGRGSPPPSPHQRYKYTGRPRRAKRARLYARRHRIGHDDHRALSQSARM